MTAPTTAAARAARRAGPGDLVVGMADLQLSASPDERLVTYALGSCLGITVWDPVARVGGMLHVMLPASSIDAEKAARNPAMFVDTGVPLLFKESYKLGARKERLVVRVVGGAHQAEREDADQFQIGKRNLLALRKLLWRNNVLVRAEDVGGSRVSRTVYLDAATGALRVRATTPDGARDFLL